MKNKTEQYFNQKDFSVIEIILIIVAVISVFVMIFMRGGIPIGTPFLLASIVAFCIVRSFKIKDSEIDQLLDKIIQDNNIERSETVIECYDLKNTAVKKRKDGKTISPKYYITNIKLSSEDTVFTVYNIDLISETVEKSIHSIGVNDKIVLAEETVKTNVGTLATAYLEFCDCVIPVTLKEYKTAELVRKICDRHK